MKPHRIALMAVAAMFVAPSAFAGSSAFIYNKIMAQRKAQASKAAQAAQMQHSREITRGQALADQFQAKLATSRSEPEFVEPQTNYGEDPRKLMLQRIRATQAEKAANPTISNRSFTVDNINSQGATPTVVVDTNKVILPAVVTTSAAEQNAILNSYAQEKALVATTQQQMRETTAATNTSGYTGGTSNRLIYSDPEATHMQAATIAQ